MQKKPKTQNMESIAKKVKSAALTLGLIDSQEKNKALKLMAQSLLDHQDYLLQENKKDLTSAEKEHYSKALIQRLSLTEKGIKQMAVSLKEAARLSDPIGQLIKSFRRPNGLMIKKIRVPIGVVAIVFESRPNVTSDCLGLCLKSGNAVILKGGREAFYSNRAIFKVLMDAVKKSSIPQEAFYLIDSTDRASFQALLSLDQYVDMIIPRGGEELIRFVVDHTRIPVVKHYKGLCAVYVSSHADLNMAHQVCLNAKIQKPGVCNAMETMLVHQDVAQRFLPIIVSEMQEAGVEIRGCPLTQKIVKSKIVAATTSDWETEFLDLILAVKVVENTQAAIDHINQHGSHHSDAIITDDKKEAAIFLQAIDSACVYVNASTRFTDGYQFGFGAEIGISTDKLHARGPMALEELTTYKYLISGKGQIRT